MYHIISYKVPNCSDATQVKMSRVTNTTNSEIRLSDFFRPKYVLSDTHLYHRPKVDVGVVWEVFPISQKWCSLDINIIIRIHKEIQYIK